MKKNIDIEKEMESFDDFTINKVWEKAKPYKRFELYKKDRFGSLMFFDDLGIESDNGWVISMILTKEQGGNTDLKNLEPLHWKNLINTKNQ
jgi:hypothetical protein